MRPHDDIRVLVAEDDYLISELIQANLRRAGYTVAGVASNGPEAVDMTCALQPDVVLMDVEMPEVDGLEASRRIQQQCPTPVVVLSAHHSDELFDRAGVAGVGAYLTKPPDVESLSRGITIAMARFDDLIALRCLNEELAARTEELEQALAQVNTLRGIIPICMHCKRIRDDRGYWEQVEAYVARHSDATFSHGLCPHCERQFYPDAG